jgi:hypothetical protein
MCIIFFEEEECSKYIKYKEHLENGQMYAFKKGNEFISNKEVKVFGARDGNYI